MRKDIGTGMSIEMLMVICIDMCMDMCMGMCMDIVFQA